MKTLIIYSSKDGTTEKIAKVLQKNFNNAKLYNLINNGKNAPDPDNYDLIIAGSGIFFGRIHSSLKKYLNKNLGHLVDQKFALYITCKNSTDKIRKRYLDKNFKGMLQDYAITAVCLDKSETHNNEESTEYKYSTPAQRNSLPNIDFKEIDSFINLIKSITITTEEDKSKINPVPPMKDIITAKQKDELQKKNKQEQKQKTMQKKTEQKNADTAKKALTKTSKNTTANIAPTKTSKNTTANIAPTKTSKNTNTKAAKTTPSSSKKATTKTTNKGK